MNKKTFTIIAVVIILALIGVGAYLYFNKTLVTTAPTGGLFPEEGPLGATKPGTGGGDGEGSNIPFIPGSDNTLPRLYELHKSPVAGSSFFESGKGLNRTVITRYIERGLGHIYETSLSTLSKSRISNETHSRLSEALWGNSGKSVIIRSVSGTEGSISTRLLNLNSSVVSFTQSTSTAQTGDFKQTEEILLLDNIPFLATAEDGSDKIFFLENSNTSSSGSIMSFRGVLNISIFNSSFTEWLPQFPNQKLITLTTKPSANIPGHFFFLNTATKITTKILSDINGLTTLTSRDGKLVLFSETKNGAPELFLYKVNEKKILPLFLQTLPEKCAWSAKELAVVYCAVPQTIPTAEYPDQWYQGIISFSDSLWKINTVTFVAEKIYNLPSLDIINPSLSSDDVYFLFMNKITSTPWVYFIVDGNTITKPTTGTTTKSVTPTITTGTTTKSVTPTITTGTTTKSVTPTPTNTTEGMVKIK